MSATVRNIIDTIGFMDGIVLDEDHCTKNLLRCAFIDEVQRAFKELKIDFVLRRYGIVLDHNGEYNIQFSYHDCTWVINGSLMTGSGYIRKYNGGDR